MLLPGFTLAYDMVFVPHWRYDSALVGLAGVPPRAVPSDLVAAALTTVLPGDLVQKLLLLSIFVIGCTGADRLLKGLGSPPGARVAAMVFFVWNPFVAERLLLGQWALLLGYAGLPWAVDAARRGSGPRAVAAALLPAAVGGFMAMIVTLLALLPFRRWRTVAVWTVLALPWLLPALLNAGDLPADRTGAVVFSARADTPFGPFGSLLCLSGVWNAEVVPPAYGLLPFAVVRMVLAVVLICAGARVCPPLTVAAVLGLAVAMCEVALPGLLGSLVGFWPGFAVLRDAQQFVAPLALVQALGLAALVGAARRVEPAALLGTAAPLLLLPGMVLGCFGRLSAVEYPADFARARALMAADPVPGDVLLLPWQAYRSYPWNGGRGSLDPLIRYLPRPVVYNDAVRIGTLTVPGEDARARELTPLVTSGAELTGPLLRAGFRYVVVDAETGAFRDRFPGLPPVIDGPGLVLYVLGPPTPKEG